MAAHRSAKTVEREDPPLRCRSDAAAELSRLREVHAQLGEVIAMTEERRSCGEIVTRLAAATKALNQAGFAIIAASLRSCMQSPDERVTGAETPTVEELEALLLSLA